MSTRPKLMIICGALPLSMHQELSRMANDNNLEVIVRDKPQPTECADIQEMTKIILRPVPVFEEVNIKHYRPTIPKRRRGGRNTALDRIIT